MSSTTPDTTGTSESRRIRAATTLFSIATAFSRVAGLVREAATSTVFGATTLYSAFVVANQIPNLLRSIVADSALSAAFVPAFTELREHDEEERAWRVASAVTSIMLCVLGPITVLAMIFAPYVVRPFVDQTFDPHQVHVAIGLTRLMLPNVLILSMSGIIVGILNSYDRFGAAAFAPVLWNAVLLMTLAVCATLVPSGARLWVYALAMVTGTLVQALFPAPWLRGLGHRITLTRAWHDPHVRQIFVRMFPVMISLGLINLQLVLSSFFAAHVNMTHFFPGVEKGAGPAFLDKAFRLYMLPQGIFSVAVSTVMFPVLSRFAARGDRQGFATAVDSGVRQILTLLIPSAVFLCVFNHEVIRVLYQFGKFNSAQTSATASVLSAFSIGLTFNGLSLLLIRSFFAMKLTWMPTIVSVLTLVVNVGLAFATYQHGGAHAIALATSTSDAVGAIALYLLLIPRTAGLGTGRTLVIAGGVLACAGVAVGAAYGVWRGIEHLIGESWISTVVGLAAALGIAAPIYLQLGSRLGLFPRGFVRQILRRRSGGEPA